MRSFRFFLFAFFTSALLGACFFSFSGASLASQEYLAPTKVSFELQPGESASYSMVYQSGMGGVFDLSSRSFSYDSKGDKQYHSEVPAFVTFDQNTYEFQPGEEKLIPVEIHIPLEMEERDIYLTHFFRRRSDERQTFELGSLLFLRIGKAQGFEGVVSNVRFEKNESTEEVREGFHAITFDFENVTDRYFGVTPKLTLYSSSGDISRVVEGQVTYVFPEFVRTVSFVQSVEDLSFPGSFSRAVFSVAAEDGKALYEQELPLEKQQIFFSQKKPEPPFQVSDLPSEVERNEDEAFPNAVWYLFGALIAGSILFSFLRKK